MENRRQPARSHTLSTEPGRRHGLSARQTRVSIDGVRPAARPVRESGPISAYQQTVTPEHPAPRITKPARRAVHPTRPAKPRTNKSIVLKRHIVERAQAHREDIRDRKNRHILAICAVLVVLVSLITVMWAFSDIVPIFRKVIPQMDNSGQPTAPKVDQPVVKSNTELDEQKPTQQEIARYQSAVDAPRVLRIQKLGIAARVKRVGSSLNGEPIAPTNIFDIGWFSESSRPTEQGTVVLDGHEMGQTKPGILHDITKLVPKDSIELERGDGVKLRYSVIRVQSTLR